MTGEPSATPAIALTVAAFQPLGALRGLGPTRLATRSGTVRESRSSGVAHPLFQTRRPGG